MPTSLVYIIYALVIFAANTVGAIAGMGGGVIIKPALEVVDAHTLAEIALFSAVAAFTMSLSSTLRQLKSGANLELKKALSVSLGAVLGGFLGDWLFQYLLTLLPLEEHMQIIQDAVMIGTLAFVLVFTIRKLKGFHFQALPVFFGAGLFLGAFSTLMGIGGGPVNVVVLMLLFAMTIKEAVVYSIVTIFFSQLAKLLSIGFTSGFAGYDLLPLLVVVPIALIGGYTGGRIGGKLSDQKVTLVYNLVVIGVIGINAYNIFAIFQNTPGLFGT